MQETAKKVNREPERSIAAFMAAFFVLVAIRVFIYNAFDKNIADETVRVITSLAFKLIIWVAPVFLYLIFIDKTDPFRYLKLSTSPKRAAAWCCGVLLAGIVWQALEIMLRGDTIGAITPAGLLSLVFIPVFEEIPTRGFILGKLSESMNFWKANVINAAFFLLLHLPGWIFISPGKSAVEMLFNSVSVFFIVGLLGGYLRKKSDSLYPPILLHIINNFISGI